MKFLIQTIEGEVVHDFAFTLIQQIKEHNLFEVNRPEPNIIEYILTDFENIFDYREYIPIGSVEFVRTYLQIFYKKDPKPINIPISLNNDIYTDRKVFNLKGDEIKNYTGPNIFIKSNDKIKGVEPLFLREQYKVIVDSLMDNVEYFCSEIIDIDSEWRGFVHNGILLDIRNYSGDPLVFPDVWKVKKMIRDYSGAPVAYTIDVALTVTMQNTVLIECHDFFSCGLYGFNHPKLPWMFSQWFYQYIKK